MENINILDIFKNKRYRDIAIDLSRKYKKNSPFPHIAIDNFLPKKIAVKLSKEYARPNYKNKRWKYH